MRITALDLGATTGVAFGEPGAAPSLAHWSLHAKTAGKRGWLLTQAFEAHCTDYFPDVVWIEAPPNLAGMMQRGTTIATLQSLYGYGMLIEVAAARIGLRVETVDVQVARRHFVGKTPSAGKGKLAVQSRCEQLNWPYDGPDEADAACVWDYACAREAPNRWMQAVQDHATKAK